MFEERKSPAMTVEGAVHTWSLGETKRQFLVTTLPFRDVRKLTRACPFSAASGQGEQRQSQPAHVRKLRNEIEAGRYTPTPVSAGLRETHQQLLVITGDVAKLAVELDEPLPLTDGFQRMSALEELLAQSKAPCDEKKASEILSLPVTLVVYLDGDTQSDFLNLNQGKPVDTTHLFSLKIRKGTLGGKNEVAVRTAAEAARLLHDDPASPFHKSVRFDDAEKAPLPLKTLCATGASDLSTSLAGVVLAGEVDAAGAAELIADVYRTLRNDAPELLEEGRLLAPPVNGGKRGTATMLAGVAACLGYAVRAREVSAAVRVKLVQAARQTLGDSVGGNLSGQRKRELMREFAKVFLAGGEKEHKGVPVGLLTALSCSAYGVPPQPARPKGKKKVTSPRKKLAVV